MSFEFETLDEYAEFIHRFLSTGKLDAPVTPQAAQAMPIPTAKKRGRKPQTLKAPAIAGKAGFEPPVEVLKKVEQFIAKGQQFKTQDAAGPSLTNNPVSRAKINHWLQKHPQLTVMQGASANGRGRGPLLYTPVDKSVKKQRGRKAKA